MKFKTTQKAIKDGYSKVYQIGYCGLYHLLKYQAPVAYTCGVYGWNADVYQFASIAITTGYRPFGEKITKRLEYDKIADFERRAQEIVENRDLPLQDKKMEVGAILTEFLDYLY